MRERYSLIYATCTLSARIPLAEDTGTQVLCQGVYIALPGGGEERGCLYAPASPSLDKLQYVLCLVYDMVRAVGA